MASWAAACRTSARLLRGRAAPRSFSTSARSLAAKNFAMPALYPMLEECTIDSWKVQEGARFRAGDVLLEVETPKIILEVEAPQDGIMMKIVSPNGGAVKVGARIAVIADPGDDIAALELPAPEEDEEESSQYRHSYPLLPSVGSLVRLHGLSREDVGKIKGTGPRGRLLKGDVLAFLGAIGADRPGTLSAQLERLSRLDLSNVKVAPRAAPAPPAAPAAAPAEPATVVVQVELSMAEVLELQRDVRDKIGAYVDVGDLVGRAARLASRELGPVPRPPTPGELFDELLGLDSTRRGRARGGYRPVISALAPPGLLARRSTPKPDIIDILAASPGKQMEARSRRAVDERVLARAAYGAQSVLSLVVPRNEKKRAQQFLARCKDILELYPQHLLQV